MLLNAASKNGNNAYFSTSSYKSHRRAADNAHAMRSFFFDIDCGPAKDYPDQAAAVQALDEFIQKSGIPEPTYVVNSGNGVHTYWCTPANIEPDVWVKLANALKSLALGLGLRIDPVVTADKARIMRAIWTSNYKDPTNPKPVELIRESVVVTKRELFAAVSAAIKQYDIALQPVEPAQAAGQAKWAPPLVWADAEMIAERCAFIAEARDTKGANFNEPAWYNMMGVLRYCADGEARAVEWSSAHPGFTESSAIRKFNQWAKGPVTCAKVRQSSEACVGCTAACRSPRDLGMPNKIVLDFDQPVEIIDASGNTTTLPKLPPRLASKFAWDSQASSLLAKKMIKKKGHDEEVEVLVEIARQFIRANFIWYDGKAHHCRVSALNPRSMAWTYGDLPYAHFSNKFKMLSELFSALGFTTHSSNYDQLEDYMKTWVEELAATADTARLADNMGWEPDGSFVLGAKRYSPSGESNVVAISGRMQEYAQAHEPLGDLPTYVSLIDKLYNHKGMEPYQFVWIASFASPLLALLTSDNIGIPIFLWSEESGVGKTTVAKVAISVWGNPHAHGQYAGADGATELAFTTMAGIRRNLPVLLDEATNWDQEKLAAFAYLYSQGTAKLQAKPEGGLRDSSRNNWKNIIFMTANKSAVTTMSLNNTNSLPQIARILDVEFPAAQVTTGKHTTIEKLWRHSGTAGHEYIRYCVMHQDEIRDKLNKTVHLVNSLCETKTDARFWVQAVSCAMVAYGITRKLGLHSFDQKAFTSYAISRVEVMQESAGTVQTIRNEAWEEFIDSIRPGLLVTMDMGDLRAKRHAVLAPNHTTLPYGKVTGRYVTDEGLLYIPRTTIRRWMSTRGISMKNLRARLVRRGILHSEDTKLQLGRGTTIETGQYPCWVIATSYRDLMNHSTVGNVVPLHRGKDDEAVDAIPVGANEPTHVPAESIGY